MAKSKRGSEAAYLARKAEQMARAQEQARQRVRARIAIAGVLVVTFLIAGAFVLPRLGRKTAQPTAAPSSSPAAAAPAVTPAEAGCTQDEVVTPADDWTKHVNGSFEYDALPPSGGPHSGKTLSTGKDHFYPRLELPSPERGVHDLEHGMVVGWYDAALPDSEVAALQQVAAAAGAKKLRFVAVPWDRGEFPGGRHFVLTSWGVTRRCTRVSGAVVESFVNARADAPGLQERGFPV
ncbi:MAG: DUF3105 domain-containing protein [Mycobacteriales bacterium]